jgi:hypothetical protein
VQGKSGQHFYADLVTVKAGRDFFWKLETTYITFNPNNRNQVPLKLHRSSKEVKKFNRNPR